ncbi:penicillin-binding protein 1A [Zunongwangia endophytica]|uniref:Penicillin-binding protein 1A n=1 Tax=Zunongwangia endophytica TaxID=1808945 RepID=A0ABV8HF30_9FLAO|nr:transglycosylase domain-containing protein [Zunongwangia endophytica]MDN3594133.1 transglycosylase domain-containing protein [Zunongwangia endophytica]
MLSKLKKSPILKWFLRIFLGLFVLFILFFTSIYLGMWGEIPSKQELSELQQNKATQILSNDGKLIGKFYIFDRQPIQFEDLPKSLIEALIATEDVRFYEHNGIDNRSLARVFFKTILLQDESSGGGSTITLQLAKNIYGRKDYGALGIVVNKFQEGIMAKRIENIYSKEDILTLYFNTVPFSDNTYGIESASMKFFGKHVKDLAVEEAAVLVGMLKASHRYNPRIFPERSRLRRDVVLTQMEKYGYLTEKEKEKYIAKDLVLNYKNYSNKKGLAPYFREQIRKDLSNVLDTIKNKDGENYNIYRDGLIVHTTLDYKLQSVAEASMREHMANLQQQHEDSYGSRAPWLTNDAILKDAIQRSKAYKNLKEDGLSETEIMQELQKKKQMELFEYNGTVTRQASTIDSIKHYLKFLNSGLLSVDPKDGAVKAWVGGVDFRYFQYDHVSQSKRQVGSTFKPIVYTTAIDNGIEPCTYYSGRAVTYKDGWKPTNATSEEEDEDLNYSMKYALSHSMNTIAVKVLLDAGIPNVVEKAHQMGIESDLPEVPSIALGTAELNMKELTQAYTSFVNSGRPSTPYYITKIEDGAGNLLAEFKPSKTKEPAYSEETREIMVNMMQATVDEGTATRLRYTYGLNNDIAGKTGTTQNNKDGWFVGVTPNLVTVTWVGSDDHRIGFRNTRIGQGANSALPIFGKMMQKMNADEYFSSITSARFKQPSSEVAELLDCEPTKEDGFLKKLFGSKKDEPAEIDMDQPVKEEKQKKKKGFFSRLFGGKKKDN